MKSLTIALLLLTTWTLSAQASYSLQDPEILGEYALAQSNTSSEVQKAELIYNSDNQLVVKTDRDEVEYELSEPDKNGVIYSGEDEPNCDGGESVCSYDSLTVIRLQTHQEKSGKESPQLSIEITKSYAWSEGCGGTDDSGNDQPACDDETSTYVLNWSKELAYSIPFYTNAEHPPVIKKMSETCLAAMKGVDFDSETAYLGPYQICGGALVSFKYRDSLETAFPYFLKDWLGGNEKPPVEVSDVIVADLFDQSINLASKYKGKGTSTITSSMIMEQIGRFKTQMLKQYDTFFNIPAMDKFDNKAKIIAVNTKEKTITLLEIKIKR